MTTRLVRSPGISSLVPGFLVFVLAADVAALPVVEYQRREKPGFLAGRFLPSSRRHLALFPPYGAGTHRAATVLSTGAQLGGFLRPDVVLSSWCWTIFFLFVGMRFLDFSNRWLDYGQEAILPFFVFHQPLIMILAYFIVQWQASLIVKLLLVVLGSFAFTLGIYEGLIRRIDFLRLIFGMKVRRLARAAYETSS
jgi:hypothetical protein